MIKKSLLSLGLMASAMSMTAQTLVFHEGFDAAQTKDSTEVAWYQFINSEEGDERAISSDAYKGAGALNFFNIGEANDNNWWRRAVKFRNLPLEAGKSYRLVHYLKGSNTYNVDGTADKKCQVSVSLMQGGENADLPLLDPNGNEFRYNYQYLNPDSYEKYTHMFYFANKAAQDSTYEAKHAGKENYAPNKYFATINVYNPGDFYLDEVELVESPIAGVDFYNDVIRVNFGYATNLVSLASATGTGRLVLPNECAVVKVNGEVKEVESVELKSDGYMYIFLVEYTEEGDKVEVAFKNPSEELVYSGNLAPEGPVASFEGEVAEKNEALDGMTSWLYSEAVLMSTTPLNSSFGLDESLTEFSFTFDKDVNSTNDNAEGVAPKAILSDGTNSTELVIKEGTEPYTRTLTFVRPNSNPLAKGSYTVTLNDVVSSKDIKTSGSYILSFEVGKVKVAETLYDTIPGGDHRTVTENEGGIPQGWTVTLEKEGVPTEHTGGSGTRAFLYTNSNVQSGLYMRDWEGKAVASTTVEIPAGDTELRAYSAGWGTTGSFKATLKDSEGNVVFDENIVVATKLEKNRQGNFQIDPIRFTSKGGSYTYSIELNGANELLCGGFVLYSVTETEGDKPDTKVIAEGNFAGTSNDCAPAHGTGWKIYRADGRMRDPGANCSWGGNDWTGGGGPRVKSISNKGMNGGGAYLAGGCYLTYGEYLVQTDHGGPVVDEAGNTTPEKTLDVEAGRYSVSYYIIGWKNPGSAYTVKLDIINQSDGITGTPVYTRTDEVTEACGSGNDATSDAKKISFFWTASSAGKYILKFTAGGAGEGEAVVGNVAVETTASLAVQYATELNKALVPAKEELELAMANDDYRGATRTELESAIKEYTNPDFHTVEQYTAAFERLETLIKKMKLRRSNIDAYPTSLQGVLEGLDAAKGTKYEALPQFPIVESAYNTYKDVDYIALDDDALNEAVTAMGNNGALLKNMVETCVPLITTQINNLVSAITNLDPSASELAAVKEAENAISDDQTLVSKLKTIYAAKLYRMIADKLAAGENPFAEYDTLTLEESPVEFEVPYLIQNPSFYTTAIVPAGKENVENTLTTDFPGWNIEVIEGAIKPIFTTGWGGTAGKDWATAVYPYANCAVKTGWGSHQYKVQQLIEKLPAATYTYSMKIGHDGTLPEADARSYVFVGDSIQTYDGDETGAITRDNNKEFNLKTFTGVVPAVEGNYGSLNVGGYVHVIGGFGNIDDANLVMTGIAPNFDYAAAAKALEAEIGKIGGSGDANGDGTVSVADLSLMATYILSGEAAGINLENADVNGDGAVSVADLSAVAAKILAAEARKNRLAL